MFKSQSTGILFNGVMDDYSLPGGSNAFGLPPSTFNRIAPQKRPLSSMCPAIFVDRNSGDVRLVIGGAGGTKITSAIALVAIKHLLFNSTLKEAIDSPRIHHQLNPNEINFDRDFPGRLLDLLRDKGHVANVNGGAHSIVTGISRDLSDGHLTGAYDYKKKGSIDGI